MQKSDVKDIWLAIESIRENCSTHKIELAKKEATMESKLEQILEFIQDLKSERSHRKAVTPERVMMALYVIATLVMAGVAYAK